MTGHDASGHVGDDLVRLTGVARTYGRGATAVVAVHEVTCAVRRADRIAVTGASGSGKSTLLHLVGGLDEPTAGRIEWPALDGRPFGRPGVAGMIFQGPSLLTPLDVLDNTALPLGLVGLDEEQARRRAADALHSVGLADLAFRLPEELSGGQAQRVAVARVLAARPRLIIADEPTAQLGSAHAVQVVDLLLRAADELDAGLIIATHDSHMAARLPTRWRMADGMLMEGEPCSS
ncbi:ABC transporter ATP-binding protein [Actinomadura mexicana]|uniref:Putative ABC transport system ATP-binding protein n=1 Tax=Actinomadura mexicana TaxID=134959 RepID=A0A238UZV1_9ACTN|nr:ATP-binding cassette domain-containing protein [Actinomadura mexicana]SNR27277.1 putative ABC transport system ATP-binding protein [Actinomadura mexicana]